MQIRNTLIMAAVLVLLGGFVYFYEIRGREAREEADRQAEMFLSFDVEDVTGVEVATAGGSVTAVKSDGEWRITAPLETAADGGAIDAMIDRLQGAAHTRVVTEEPEDLAPFGLAPPQVEITLQLGDTSQALSLGKDTPVGPNLYAATDGTKVYSAESSLRSALDKSLDDLRDRTVLSFDEDAVRRVEIRYGDLQADIDRDGADPDRWLASAPFAGRADTETIDDLLSELAVADALTFVLDAEPSTETLSDYGLDTPMATVTLWTEADASLQLVFGSESEEPVGRYAMRAGGAAVMVIDNSVLDTVPETSTDLRNKLVVDLPRERVRTVAIRGAGRDDLAVERVGIDWVVTEPRTLEADASALSRLLSALEDLRAEGFGAADFAPRLELELGLRAEQSEAEAPVTETLRVRVGEHDSIVPLDAEGEDADPVDVVWMAVGDDDVGYAVLAEDVADLDIDLYDLRAKTLVEFDQAELSEMELTAGGDRFVLARAGDAWQVGGQDLEGEAATDLLWDLNYLRMNGVALEWEETAPDLTEFGLGAPRYHLVARTADGTAADISFGNLRPGEDGAGGQVYVLADGRTGVFEVSESLLVSVETLLGALRGE